MVVVMMVAVFVVVMFIVFVVMMVMLMLIVMVVMIVVVIIVIVMGIVFLFLVPFDFADPGGGGGHFLEVEHVRVEDKVEIDVAVVALYDLGGGLQGQDNFAQAVQLGA